MKINIFVILFAYLILIVELKFLRERRTSLRAVDLENFQSFIQIKSKEDTDDMNSAFDDELAVEDKFDRNIHRHKPYRDYNSEVELNTEDLTAKVEDDLKGEDVNYKFD